MEEVFGNDEATLEGQHSTLELWHQGNEYAFHYERQK